MYTLGGLMVSADDDMRPYTLMEHSPESLDPDEVCRGRLHKVGQNGYSRKSFDILTSFLDVLGKPAGQVPDNYERGELLVDTAMDLETNATKGLARENSLLLQRGPLPDDAVVKMAQTFRSGTNDIDAIDYVEMFLDDEGQTNPDDLNDVYVLVNFRPVVTKKNWRMDCGVAGYDNTFGLPPFFPTRLRFEDYIYRLWVQQDGIAAAHVDAAQNHTKSNYMRNPPAAEIFNEEVSNLLKRKIKATRLAPGRAEHRVRLRRRGDGAGRPGDPRQDRGAVRAGRGSGRDGSAARSGPRRCGCSRPTCRRRSTASSPTSSSRTCCGSWTTSSASSRARSSCGRRWWRSATSRRTARDCPRSGSRIRRSEHSTILPHDE